MTQINTQQEIHKRFGNGIPYLKEIGFLEINDDGISFITDEEGNNEILLNKDCALWIALSILNTFEHGWKEDKKRIQEEGL